MDTIQDWDREHLTAFPIPAPLVAIHGPDIRPLNVDPERGWYDPDPGGDYDSWTAVTGDGHEFRVPPVLVARACAANGGQQLWEVDFRGTTNVAERQSLMDREMERVRTTLNDLARELLGGDRSDRTPTG